MGRLSVSPIDLLTAITDYAKKYVEGGKESVIRNSHMNDLEKNDSITQEQVEAVVTDFINFIGMEHGVDYALYSEDLKNDKWRK